MSPQTVIAERIEAFLRTEFDIDPSDTGFDRKVDLFQLGYIDSVGFAELLAFLGEEFGVDIPEAELLSDDFLRIDGIASIVSRLVAADSVGIPVLAEEHTL
jgi:D-alanine--poly(phosphoribitol) ligase subunit 2